MGSYNTDSRWAVVSEASGDGTVVYRLGSWKAFFDFLESEVFRDGTGGDSWVWRGQREGWSLRSSLDRLLDQVGLLGQEPTVLEQYSRVHLERFKYAARGRRGMNPAVLQDRDWWALGQHFGLATPLLDWTRSPFAAAYFAFEEPVRPDVDASRVVFGLHRRAVEQRGASIDGGSAVGPLASIEFIDPFSDENPRLVNQGALFTRGPIGVPIETWVANAFEGSETPVLLRIELPATDRLSCLRVLHRMNINHVSLFPDLGGASRYVNLCAELEPLEGAGHVRPPA